jgi:hypothetical protein
VARRVNRNAALQAQQGFGPNESGNPMSKKREYTRAGQRATTAPCAAEAERNRDLSPAQADIYVRWRERIGVLRSAVLVQRESDRAG